MKKLAMALLLVACGLGVSACDDSDGGNINVSCSNDSCTCEGTGSKCIGSRYIECDGDEVVKNEKDAYECTGVEKVDHKASEIPAARQAALDACDTLGTACDNFFGIKVADCKAGVPDLIPDTDDCANAAYEYYDCLTKKFCDLKDNACSSKKSKLTSCIVEAYEASFPAHVKMDCNVDGNAVEHCKFSCQGTGTRCVMAGVYSYLIACENDKVVSDRMCNSNKKWQNLCADNQIECKK